MAPHSDEASRAAWSALRVYMAFYWLLGGALAYHAVRRQRARRRAAAEPPKPVHPTFDPLLCWRG